MLFRQFQRPALRRAAAAISPFSTSSEIVFTMTDVEKTVGHRRLFQNVNLNFLRGAKIGVLGLNGAGKSSLLRIIAGLDKDVEGLRHF